MYYCAMFFLKKKKVKVKRHYWYIVNSASKKLSKLQKETGVQGLYSEIETASWVAFESDFNCGWTANIWGLNDTWSCVVNLLIALDIAHQNYNYNNL